MVIKLGSIAYKKYGPENITLVQLAQAEEDGLWADECLTPYIGQVLQFRKDTNETQKEVTI